MPHPDRFASFRLPDHLVALQSLVDRCPTPATRKELIVTAGMCRAISRRDGCVMVSANMLETA